MYNILDRLFREYRFRSAINFIETYNEYIDTKRDIEREGRLLRIGIIGTIKSGKSTFINELLFNGNEILPSASTPMTASLSIIKYSKDPYLIVRFYSKEGWNKIIEDSKREDKSEIVEACKEIVKMAQGLRIEDYIGKEERIKLYSIENAKQKIREYVSSESKKSSLVEWIELGINIESLKDIEIVDTPGLNDPIISRSQITQNFISKCDVVFLLSYTDRFLDEKDVRILVEKTQRGLRELYVIASKYDSGLKSYILQFKNIQNLGDIVKALYQKLNRRLMELVEQRIKDKHIKDKILREGVILLSSYIRKYKRGEYDNNIKNLEEDLKKKLPRVELNKLDDGFRRIERILENIKFQKEGILKQRIRDITQGYRKQLQEEIEKVIDEIERYISDMKNGEIQKINKEIEQIEKIAKEIKYKLENYDFGISKSINDLEKLIESKAQEMKKRIDNLRRVGERIVGKKEITKFLCIKEEIPVYDKYEYYERDGIINYIQDEIDKLENEVNKTIKEIIDSKRVRIEITKILKEYIHDIKKYEEEIKNIRVGNIRKFIISRDAYTQKFYEFPDKIYAENIPELTRILEEILEYSRKNIEKLIYEIKSEIKEKLSNLVNQVLGDITNKLLDLKKRLNNRQEHVKRLEEILFEIRSNLRGFQL